MAVVIGYVAPNWPAQEDESLVNGHLPAHVVLKRLHAVDRDLPVVISTGQSHTSAIVELIKRGGFDYVIEPLPDSPPDRLEQYDQEMAIALDRAVQWRRVIVENRKMKRDLLADDLPLSVLARSESMRRVLDLARKVAPTPATALITGESGVGKEVVARVVHGLSTRSKQPFIVINCGAMTETLLNSELFGHVKGREVRFEPVSNREREIEIAKGSDDVKGFEVRPKCWIMERSSVG